MHRKRKEEPTFAFQLLFLYSPHNLSLSIPLLRDTVHTLTSFAPFVFTTCFSCSESLDEEELSEEKSYATKGTKLDISQNKHANSYYEVFYNTNLSIEEKSPYSHSTEARIYSGEETMQFSFSIFSIPYGNYHCLPFIYRLRSDIATISGIILSSSSRCCLGC